MVRPYLNGYTRMIIYFVTQNKQTKKYDPLSKNGNRNLALKEGKITNGLINGFARIIDFNLKTIQLGFFQFSKPHGKNIKYKEVDKNGKIER